MSISVGLFHFLSLVCPPIFSSVGANPSAEEQEEGVEDGASTVNNVVHSFRLQPTSFDKKSFLTYLKVIMPLYLVHTSSHVILL